MNQQDIIQETADFVKEKFTAEGGGHDWWHMYRVWQLAKAIAKEEKGADHFVVELGALLHDIADWKYHDGDADAGPKAAEEWLQAKGVEQSVIDQVSYIVRHISYRGGTNKHVMQSLEGKIVQDADRLDALGAVGIGRAFAFGGRVKKEMHDPQTELLSTDSFEEYQAKYKDSTTINHFYEKLLKLKDGMHTETAKKIAQARHDYMEEFLEEFYAEWDGKR